LKKVIYFILVFGAVACKSKEEKIKPQITNLTESVYSSVTLQPDSLYEVYASVNGILDHFFVGDGELVKMGDPIAQIINTTPKLNADNARIALELAQQNASRNSTILGTIANEISNAQLKLKNDSINFERQKSLWSQNIGSKAEYDSKKLIYETSQTALKMLIDKLARTKYELNTALSQAMVQYQTAQNNAKDFTIFSKINGKVYTKNKNQGELVSAQMPIATIGSKDQYILEMLIDEVDITKLKLGQTILVTLDAYKKKVFEAKLSKIYPSKDLRTQTFKVEGIFTNRPEILYPGLSGEANIIINTKSNVLSIPNKYLSEDNKVMTENGLVEVTIGLQSMESTEIIKGLDADTYIYKLK
jgi:HlyD family secretion protein